MRRRKARAGMPHTRWRLPHIFPSLSQEAGGAAGLRPTAGCDWLPTARSAAPIGEGSCQSRLVLLRGSLRLRGLWSGLGAKAGQRREGAAGLGLGLDLGLP